MNGNAVGANSPSRDKRSTHRFVQEWIVVTGTLLLETPASFGNGDADAFTDMPLLEDEVDRSPLLTGTSIAGALRNYLREWEQGFETDLPREPGKQNAASKNDYDAAQKRERKSLTVRLFGGYSGDDEGWQSPLIIHDARGKAAEY
jgi:CRISPR/Cas system CMR subunit Cmr4 (Cas7 group RAMP superfamily)